MKTPAQCPNCSQYKVVERRARTLLLGGWLTFVGIATLLFVIGILILPFGLGLLIIAPFIKGYVCTNCHWTSRTLPAKN